MSLAEVQQRTAELEARLRQLSGARAAAGLPVAPTSTAASCASARVVVERTSAFATQLAEALAPAGPAAGVRRPPRPRPAEAPATGGTRPGA